MFLKKSNITFIIAVAAVFTVMTFSAVPDLMSADISENGLIDDAIMIVTGFQSPVNIIALVLVICCFILLFFFAKRRIQQKTILNRIPACGGIKKASGFDRLLFANPDFNENEFIGKVKKAFIDIQKARGKQDISGIRKFISDGMYRRFSTQFVMMNLLQQIFTIDDPEVKKVYIDRVDADGLYDIIHVGIHASISGRFVNDLEPSPYSGDSEEFAEYWSFIKRRGGPVKDIYYTYNCPGCGSPLPENMEEICRCPACDAFINSGEYDWVLIKITRADDYISAGKKFRKTAELNKKLRDILNEHDDFSIQKLEDKAGNGYLQIITSIALNDPSIMRRFVNDATYEKITSLMTGARTACDIICLNDVNLIGVSENRTLNILAFSVKSSFRRINLDSGSVSFIDPVVISKDEIILMSRDKNAARSRGPLYARCCPGCGVPVENSLEIKCPDCGIPMNSTANEWIITDLMTLSEYHDYYNENVADFNYSVNQGFIDKSYDIRDFAFNNIMVIIAADGKLTEQKKAYANELAAQWKYNLKKIEPFIKMGIDGRLVLRMPADPDKQQEIYKMMSEAVAADRNITPREQQFLDIIKREYNIR